MLVQKRFPGVYFLVSDDHQGVHGGHDIFHATRVANWAYKIALDQWNSIHIADLSALAGLCHNADRLKEKIYGRNNTPSNATQELILSWLKIGAVSPEDTEVVLQAVLRHDKNNDPSDSKVQIALMDADRLVNLEMDVIIRSAQFHPDIPAVDYNLFLSDPAAKYQDAKSVLKDIWYCLEWTDPSKTSFCFRTRLGWEEGLHRARHLQHFFDILEMQLEEGGIHSNQ